MYYHIDVRPLCLSYLCVFTYNVCMSDMCRPSTMQKKTAWASRAGIQTTLISYSNVENRKIVFCPKFDYHAPGIPGVLCVCIIVLCTNERRHCPDSACLSVWCEKLTPYLITHYFSSTSVEVNRWNARGTKTVRNTFWIIICVGIVVESIARVKLFKIILRLFTHFFFIQITLGPKWQVIGKTYDKIIKYIVVYRPPFLYYHNTIPIDLRCIYPSHHLSTLKLLTWSFPW